VALQTQKRRKIEKKNRNKKRRAFFFVGGFEGRRENKGIENCSLLPLLSRPEKVSTRGKVI
jgi:hypothetical protein